MNFKINTLFIFALLLVCCKNKSKVEKAVEQMPLQMELYRFDQQFFSATPQSLPKLKQTYPFFFPQGIEDKVWLDKIQDPQWRALYKEVEVKYKNFEPQKLELEILFKHIKYYFPAIVTPKIYAVIGEMDLNTKTIYANDKLIIALEFYIGKNHPFYDEFPAYLRQNFEVRQMLPDVVAAFAEQIVPPPTDKTLLSQMMYHGKQLYLKTLLLPNYTDFERIGYSAEQEQWCIDNESYMWQYFIEKKLLFSADSRLENQFINVAPFSKFYLEIDNESPGRVGQWLGWQIVQSYANNKKVALQQLLKTDAKQIFEQSKYKPRKNEQ